MGEGVIDTERAVLEPVPVANVSERRAPRLAEGTELIGEYQGSGFQQPKYILRRADGQVIQVPHLLYLLAGHIDGQRDVQQLANQISGEFGRDLQVDQISFLLDKRLRPAGILAPEVTGTGTAEPPAAPMRSDPLLSLRFRMGVVPERFAWIIAGIFQALFFPPVLLVGLAAFVAFDVMLVLRGGLGQIESSALAIVHQPTLTLLVLVMLLVCAAFHECGHVAACRYGGARPGRMGFGIYLVWPALYSTVTDAYRLSRRGRLRTDLGGVYFNVVFIAGMSLAYLETASPWLLITIAMMHIETVRQFIPFIRLDGYYILSDLIGVPDLFSRMGPVLKSLIPRREPHPRVQELKPWVRRVVTMWVVLVIPALIYFLLPFVILAPRVLPVVWDALGRRGPEFTEALRAGELASAAVGMVQMFLLVLPWAGAALIFGMMALRLVRAVRSWWRRSRPDPRRLP